VNNDNSKDQENKLGKQLEALDPILLGRFRLYPRANDHETKNTYDTIYGEKDEKSKKDIIELPHLILP
jgi:hypothetical protein